VLLLHGLASTRHIWDLVVPGLAGLPVLALDQHGHGDSDRPEGPYDGEAVVGDGLTALDALGAVPGDSSSATPGARGERCGSPRPRRHACSRWSR